MGRISGLILLFLMLAWPSTAAADKRVALVIGNAAYLHTAPLRNPSNDASDLAAALKRLGFEVILGLDLDYAGMRSHARRFADALTGAEIGLFFYAGHGVQVAGANYLAPVDANLASETDLEFGTVRLDVILRQIEREAPTSIVFLDACRNNPMATNLSRSMGTRSASVGRGLARIESGVGTLIAFATQPGNVALDGKGRNSPFTSALVEAIETPGLDLGGVMIEVRNAVLSATGGKQVPWEHSSLTGRVFLAPRLLASTAAGAAGHAGDDTRAVELAFWESIRGSNNPRLFESYLKRYPEGAFADIARVQIEDASAPKLPPGPDSEAGKPLRSADEVRQLQELLYELNYDPGPADGRSGNATKSALREFQQQVGLEATGEATRGLLERLRGMDRLKPWGAIVYSSRRQDWGMAWGTDSRKAALTQAQASCKSDRPCEAELTFFGTECGAFAHSEKGWAIVARDTLKQAKSDALDDCRKQGGDCRIIATVCADGAEKQVAAQ